VSSAIKRRPRDYEFAVLAGGTILGIVWGIFALSAIDDVSISRSFVVADTLLLPLMIGLRIGAWLAGLGLALSPQILVPGAGACLGLMLALVLVLIQRRLWD
jgi:hypothetical protein